MKRISNLINQLLSIKNLHGDLLLGGGDITDSSGPNEIIVLDEQGCCADVAGKEFKPKSIFFET